MDRALLERMIGAAVLLLLLVVVAPTLLDGPSDEAGDQPELILNPLETRVETIVLDVAPGSEPEEIQAAAEVAQPFAVEAEPGPEAKPEPRPEPKPESRPEPKPEPDVKAVAAQPVAPSAAAAGNFIVQLGVFKSRENAENLSAKIKSRGFSVKLMPVTASSGTMYRVYVGPRKTREDADQLVKIMANSGYKGIVVSLEGGG